MRGVCFDTAAQMCSCISSSEVYDPDPRLSGGGQEQFLCVVVFNRLEKQITLTVAKSWCSRKVSLYTHEIPTCYLSKAALAFKMLLKDSRHANSYCYCYMLTKSLTEASCSSFLPSLCSFRPIEHTRREPKLALSQFSFAFSPTQMPKHHKANWKMCPSISATIGLENWSPIFFFPPPPVSGGAL